MNKLEFLRKKHKFTQRQIAEMLDVSLYHYKLMEQNKEVIPIEQINTLSKFYNVTPDFLIEDPRKLLNHRIQNCPEEWISEIHKFMDFLEYKTR